MNTITNGYEYSSGENVSSETVIMRESTDNAMENKNIEYSCASNYKAPSTEKDGIISPMGRYNIYGNAIRCMICDSLYHVQKDCKM